MKHILVVDDSKAVHAFMDCCFVGDSFALSHAYNGQEALDLFAADKKYDLVFLDWEMPILDGPSTLRAIKSKNLNMPVVMVTSKNKPEDIFLMLELGAIDYIMKPFTLDVITEKIKVLFEGKAA